MCGKSKLHFKGKLQKSGNFKKEVEIGVRGILFECLFVYLVGWLYSLSKAFGGCFGRETIYVQRIVMALPPGLPDPGLSDAVGQFPLLAFLP